MAALMKEEKKAPERRQRKRETEETDKVEVSCSKLGTRRRLCQQRDLNP